MAKYRSFSTNIIVIILICTTLQLNAQNSNMVANFSGIFNVSPTGAATYSIPIEMPPGISAMQPNLSIVYNSQSGNGLLGMGFDLGGLSQITRTPKNMYYDNEISIVDFNKPQPACNATFSLDGNRLSQVNQHRYKTTIETFSDIVFDNSHWTVHTKDGKRLEYSFTTDVEAMPIAWRLNKITDVNGNSLVYNYGKQNGESWLDSINYTNNSILGLQGTNTVLLIYEDRYDYTNEIYPGFIPNSLVSGGLKQSKRLKQINVLQNNIIQRSYTFSYDNGGLCSRLVQIEVTSNGKAMLPIRFFWGVKDNYKIVSIDTVLNKALEKKQLMTADFNGDNLSDVLLLSKSQDSKHWQQAQLYMTIKNAEGIVSFHAKQTIDLSSAKYGAFTMDVNNDLKEDLVIHNMDNGDMSWYSYNSIIQSFQMNPIPDNFKAQLGTGSFKYLVADFNADGRSDLLTQIEEEKKITEDRSYVTSGHVDCFFNGCKYETAKGAIFPDKNINIYTDNTVSNNFQQHNGNGLLGIVPIDFNGDGRSDLLYNSLTLMATSDCRKDKEPISVNEMKNNPAKICGNRKNASDWTFPVLTSFYNLQIKNVSTTGINLNDEENVLYNINDIERYWGSKELDFGDFNGDGKTDIVLWEAEKIFYSNGINYANIKHIEGIKPTKHTFFYHTVSTSYTTSDYYDSLQICEARGATYREENIVIDFNGDGKADILRLMHYYENYVPQENVSCPVNRVYSRYKHTTLQVRYAKNTGNFTEPEIIGTLFMPDSSNMAFGDFNGDGKIDILNFNHQILLSGNDNLYKVLTINDGFNITVAIQYQAINENKTIYKPYTDAIYPLSDVTMPFKVVSQTNTMSYDKIFNNEIHYAYEGLKIHKFGKGLLGFMKFISTNPKDKMVTQVEFELDKKYFVLNPKQTSIIKNGVLINRETVVNEIQELGIQQQHYMPFISQKTSENFIKNIKTEEYYTYDAVFNPISINTKIYDILNLNMPAYLGYQNQINTYTSKGNYSNIPNKILSTTTEKQMVNAFNDWNKQFFEYDNQGNLFRNYTLIDAVNKIYNIDLYYYDKTGYVDSMQNVVSTLYAYGPVFYNKELKSEQLLQTNCSGDFLPSKGVYVVGEKKYISYVSQAAADDSASLDITNNAQNYINATAICKPIYYNEQMISRTYIKNDCKPKYKGSEVSYEISARTIKAFSQQELQKQMMYTFDQYGQDYANEKGSCNQLYYSQAMDSTFNKFCSGDSTGRSVAFHIPRGIDSSIVSQQEADSLARYKLIIQGERHADEKGICLLTYKNTIQDSVLYNAQCDSNKSKPRPFIYTVIANQYRDTLSQKYVDSLARDEIKRQGQDTANTYGVCVQLITYFINEAQIQKNTCVDDNERIRSGVDHDNHPILNINKACKDIKESVTDTKILDY